MCFFFSSFEQKDLDGQYFDAVDLVETAFNKLADNVVSAYLFSCRYQFSTHAIQETDEILRCFKCPLERIPSDSKDGYMYIAVGLGEYY